MSHKIRGVAQLASALRSGRRGRKFESSHPDELQNQNNSKACKSNDLQAFLFLRSQNKPYKTVVNVNKTVSKFSKIFDTPFTGLNISISFRYISLNSF